METIWLGNATSQIGSAFHHTTLSNKTSSKNTQSLQTSSTSASQANSNIHTLNMANKQGFAAYPPTVESNKILGYVEEVNGIFHSRDIGRSFELFGNVYLKFGDTFCNNSNGEFVGLANNTVAIIEDTSQPLKSQYLEVEENGFIEPFIQLTYEEQKFEEKKEGRVVLWAFGGVVEMEDGTGRLWYQKSIDHGSGNLKYCGTGIAKVVGNWGYQPIAQRMDNLIFGPDEPRMGTFTAIADGDFIYLYGDRPDGKIILARVYHGRYDDRVGKKEAHCYWDGSNWVHDWREAAVVMEDMQQGAIIRSKLFGEDRPFMFVGTSKWADSQVFMGASARLEGPWKLEAVCRVDGIKEPTSRGKWMYCIYPQLWASDEKNAELMVTWSEQYPGGVIAASIKLARVTDDNLDS